MNILFAETLKKLRKEKGLSQIQLGNLMFVNHSTFSCCAALPDSWK